MLPIGTEQSMRNLAASCLVDGPASQVGLVNWLTLLDGEASSRGRFL